ncbi:IclR family transcriptional regulator [Pseudonocardia sp. KRD-184]|uniref:IclR family transcriptional regulator n=1 Tax=Pseudonocardia oceani TaxID=2792013 RepID=A0ABS6UDS6_9PSEU|nr:IclR family transcriptional regulator [Pseudonocardia oceani]MBW0088587.1 IclR family transcriptional regulator [Pseudonocardia oceani]MBW0094442.1 IclR family transcriptional regulator [Pseudonocardia oceani]MBW0108153.1 IclR family transcriptional regulator [Pseudonocardia oceani]MBW0119951.1 IclR family transcriptional regulator [Pseudonocardia oceani]MBW0130031.1 IclR family transcriptional regulator [Pseudonocardia oceani]
MGDTVTARVLGVLDAFSAAHPELTLTEIARRAALPLSTAHRLVGELAGWGALERGDDGRYRIGLRLWEVGALAPRSVGLREAAMPFLTDLHEVTGENVQLAVLDGAEVVYVDRISGRGAVNVITRVGGRLPLHATGVGLVLLAHAPAALQEQVLAAPLRRYTERTICAPAELRRVLADVRRTGVAVSDRQIELVALSVAAPVRGPRDEVVAALSVVVPAATSDARAYVPVVRAAARGVSRSLGASG